MKLLQKPQPYKPKRTIIKTIRKKKAQAGGHGLGSDKNNNSHDKVAKILINIESNKSYTLPIINAMAKLSI